jgi:hypothetical protein
MCTTSIECKTVITAVLTVMSCMNPHIISRDFGWFGNSSVVKISSWRWNILVESSSWSWRFCGSVIQLELDIRCCVIQLELNVLCHDVLLELDVHLVNRSIKA